jgi:prevent-host-death family protein
LRISIADVTVRKPMGKDTYTVTAAQSQLPRLVREAEKGRPIAISRRDQTVAYILSQERLEAIVETMEILANPAARRAVENHRARKTRFLPLSALDKG